MRKQVTVIMLIGALMLMPAVGFGDWQSVVQNMPNGQIDWSQRIVQAKGIGVPGEKYMGKPQARPMALRAAQLDAQRNLLEITKGVQLTSTTMVKDYVVESDIIMSRVDGVIKGAQVVDTQYMSDGTVEVTVQMRLDGALAQAVLPSDIQDVAPVTPLDIPDTPDTQETPDMPPAPAPAATTPGQDAVAPQMGQSGVYTGLVVDARGLNARPAMSPKVVDEDGQEVYGSAFVSREYAIQQGMSGYAKQLEAAQANSRVTDNPLTVKGLSTKGPGQCDIVISDADASMLRSASDNLSFMKKCRVMIVVD